MLRPTTLRLTRTPPTAFTWPVTFDRCLVKPERYDYGGMPERTSLHLNLKYSWQHAVVDALMEWNAELLPDKIAAAERVISERLVQERADADEQVALRGALIALDRNDAKTQVPLL